MTGRALIAAGVFMKFTIYARKGEKKAKVKE